MNNEVNNTPTPLTDQDLDKMRNVAHELHVEAAQNNDNDTQVGLSYLFRLLDEHTALKKVLQAVENFRGGGVNNLVGRMSEGCCEDLDRELYDATEGARHLLAVRT